MFAPDRSRRKNEATITKMTSVRNTPYPIANRVVSRRCVGRETGAMNVYSIVPSQRSQAIISLIAEKITGRYDQISVHTKR